MWVDVVVGDDPPLHIVFPGWDDPSPAIEDLAVSSVWSVGTPFLERGQLIGATLSHLKKCHHTQQVYDCLQ